VARVALGSGSRPHIEPLLQMAKDETVQSSATATNQVLGIPLSRRAPPPSVPAPRTRSVPRWVARILRVPLAGKIAGANGIIVIAAIIAAFALSRPVPQSGQLTLILGAALAGSLIANVVLVVLALRPLEDLELTAERVWRGDLSARVPPSLLADGDIARVGGTLNVLLDGLTADRARMRELAAEVIRVGDAERAAIARELHDSTAQSLAALLLELRALSGKLEAPDQLAALERIRKVAAGVLEDVRLLAHTVHPRVLEDLRLVAALEHLVREAQVRTDVRIRVDADSHAIQVSPAVASTLYRVAQEALANAVRHARATEVTIQARVDTGVARVEISDDGDGFDVEDAERRRPGMGLFTMRERMGLIGGTLTVVSRHREGTRVMANVPLGPVASPIVHR
jgi:signal transduction histidine kinase